MHKKGDLLSKTIIIVIIILLIGTSIVSSTGNFAEINTSYTKIIDIADSSDEFLFRGNYGYAYNAYPGPEGTVYFSLDDPGVIYECGDTESGDFLTGGTIDSEGLWYGIEYGSSVLWGIDTNNYCDMWSIGGGGNGGEIAWDDETGLLYFISGYNLFWYDPETGEGGLLGYIDVSLSQIEFDNIGTLYGFDFSGTYDMYTIDLSTLETTFVGTLTNITATWSLSVAFDKDTNNLYLLGSGLYICNIETCECTLIGNIVGIELTSFVIPYGNDNLPPVTTISFDPPEPDGKNGWYVSNVTVTLNATDENGVKTTFYRINGGEWVTYSSPFVISEEGDDILIEFYSVDNAGNIEDVKPATINIDKTRPDLSVIYEITGGCRWCGWEITFYITAYDNISGTCYIEFFINDQLMDVLEGPGPTYTWAFIYFPTPNWSLKVIAFDCAGNYAEAFLNSSDIKAYHRSIFINRYLTNVWYKFFFDIFPLLEVIISRLISHIGYI